MKTKAIIGIDAGTTNIKVVAFTLDGGIIAKEQVSVVLIRARRGYAEIDLELYWKSIVVAIKKLIATTNIDILSIGVSSTCPTTVLMDKEYKPLRCGITYMDIRADSSVKRYLNSLAVDSEKYSKLLGNRAAVASCSVSNLIWLQENEAEIWEATEYAGMLNSFIVAQFTGKTGVDWTQASYSGVFKLDSNDNRWDCDLLSYANVPESKIASIKSPFEKIGVVKKDISIETGIKQGTPVALGAADTACATFALGIRDKAEVFESVGTSGVLTFIHDNPQFDPVFMNRKHIVNGNWLAHGANSFMGAALDWLKNNIFNEFATVEDMNTAIASATPGANGVAFLPYLSGERSPIWDSKAVGVWYGITVQSDKIDLMQSVYESGAYVLRQLLEYGEECFDVTIRDIVAVGNGTKSSYWNQIKSSVLNLPYSTTSYADAAALGAALLGGIAGGLYSSPTDQALPQLKSTGDAIYPEKEEIRNMYLKTYDVYKKLYPALKDVMGGYSH